MTLKHAFNCAIADDPADEAAGKVLPSHWGQDHVVSGGFDLPAETVNAPPSNKVRMYGLQRAKRVFAAMESAEGLDTALQPFAFNGTIAAWLPAVSSTTLSMFGAVTSSASGTATAAGPTVGSKYNSINKMNYLVTTAATNAIAAWRFTANNWCQGTLYNGYFFALRGGVATGASNTSNRFYIGMRNSTASPADVEPSSILSHIGFGWDSTDTNCQIIYNDGSGTSSKIDMGSAWPVPVADASEMYDVFIHAPRNGSSVFVTVEALVSGQIFTAELTTDIPTKTTMLAPYITATVGGVSSVIGISFGGCYLENQK